ncbi:MAG: lamin tail domain-containing protein, partial [Verrucomicrobiota bacterium]
DLSGYTITDDIDDPFQWTVPAGTVLGAGAFLLIWADGNSVTETNDLHTNFKLGRGGEELAVFDDNATLIDWVVFGAQEEDFSEGLFPDGSDALYPMTIPTPGTTNRLFQIESLVDLSPELFRIEWNTRSGWLYDVMYRDAYDSNTPWSVMVSNITATGRTVHINLPGNNTSERRYFLIRQTPP